MWLLLAPVLVLPISVVQLQQAVATITATGTKTGATAEMLAMVLPHSTAGTGLLSGVLLSSGKEAGHLHMADTVVDECCLLEATNTAC